MSDEMQIDPQDVDLIDRYWSWRRSSARVSGREAAFANAVLPVRTARGALDYREVCGFHGGALSERARNQQEIDGLRAELERLKREATREEIATGKLIDERDHYEARLDKLATEAGCEHEWSTHHDRDACASDAVGFLRADLSAARKRIAELESPSLPSGEVSDQRTPRNIARELTRALRLCGGHVVSVMSDGTFRECGEVNGHAKLLEQGRRAIQVLFDAGRAEWCAHECGTLLIDGAGDPVRFSDGETGLFCDTCYDAAQEHAESLPAPPSTDEVNERPPQSQEVR
jgi:hypothetical protein